MAGQRRHQCCSEPHGETRTGSALRSIVSCAFVAAVLVACGSSAGGPSRTEREPMGGAEGLAGAPDVAAGGGGQEGGAVATAPRPAEGRTDQVPAQPGDWPATVGTWCGPGESRTTWLVAQPARATCEAAAPQIYGDDEAEGWRVELPEAALGQVPGDFEVAVRHCSAVACRTLPGQLELTHYEPGLGASGHWELTLVDGTRTSGSFDARWCAWDEYLPAHPQASPLIRGLRLHEVAVFQAVKVPLMERLLETTERNAEVVAGRPALLRAYVVPSPGWTEKSVKARLHLLNRDENGEDEPPLILEQTRSIWTASSEDQLESTFNFSIPAEAIRQGTRYAIELLDNAPCPPTDGEPVGARFPDGGFADLRARSVGGVRVQVIPVQHAGLLPDTSAEQIERLRSSLFKVFPVSHVEVAVRDQPILTEATAMVDVLDQIAALRDQEAPPRDVTYFGMVRFTENLAEYCANSCVLGSAIIGELNEQIEARAGSAVGIGYGGEAAAHTFVHELGHVYGRSHSPCNVVGDPEYPYRAGGIGSWGYDQDEQMLMSPNIFTDFMGYCSPVWVSDYVYGQLQHFIGAVNEPTLAVQRSTAPWRTLLFTEGEAPRWGASRDVSGSPPGLPEQAAVEDDSGNVVGSATVYRARAADGGQQIVYVPRLAAATARIRVAEPVPHLYEPSRKWPAPGVGLK